MKRQLSTFIFLFFASLSFAQVNNKVTTTIEFEETTFDFGTVTEGEVVTHHFKFKNNGSNPLIIKNATSSTGSVIPIWPKEPIRPGEQNVIKVQFNTKTRKGKQNKRVNIYANIPNKKSFLSIKGIVENKNATPVPKLAPTLQERIARFDNPITKTTIEFEETTFDFGTATEGEVVTHIYKFKNTGKHPLIIKNTKTSCGCVVASWPKEPIAVGASGEIKVKFNTRGKIGKQTKRITITANIPNEVYFLTIKGELIPKPIAVPPATKFPQKINSSQKNQNDH